MGDACDARKLAVGKGRHSSHSYFALDCYPLGTCVLICMFTKSLKISPHLSSHLQEASVAQLVEEASRIFLQFSGVVKCAHAGRFTLFFGTMKS